MADIKPTRSDPDPAVITHPDPDSPGKTSGGYTDNTIRSRSGCIRDPKVSAIASTEVWIQIQIKGGLKGIQYRDRVYRKV